MRIPFLHRTPPSTPGPVDPVAAVLSLLEEEAEHVVRLWAKRLRAETYELDLPGQDLRTPLRPLMDELVRLLRDRGRDALHLWPEVVRPHGARRYNQRFDAEDLAREFKALEAVLIYLYARRHERLEPEVASFIVDLVGEAHASAQASYTRVLRTEEVRFREAAVMESVLHHVDVGILLVELDGSVSFASPPVSRLLGVPMRSVVGSRSTTALATVLTQVSASHPGGAPFRVIDMPFTRALRERAHVGGVWMAVQRPGGGEVSLELSATPIFEEDGTLAGVIQTFTDRTEAANKSKALLSAHDELRRLQGRLLQRTRTQALGQLATGAAHALNNLLNVLRLRITLLRREFKPEHLDALDRTVGHVGELVARLQEFNVQRTEEHLVDVQVDSTVREALELAGPELEQREHPVSVELRLGSPGVVRADAGFFRELVVNLLLAERERLGERGGDVVVQTREEPSGEAVLRVEDGGPPYAEEEMTRMFEPLSRDVEAPQRSLLLAVAREQVRRWGGELSVENFGEGRTAFVVRLPLARAPSASVAPADSAPAGVVPRRAHGTRRVLVVDDDADNARMLAEVLEEEGYDVKVAAHGDVALKMWDERPYDAALLDAVMPDVSGWDVARELRQRSPQALLAIVTGMDVRGQNRANLALVDAVFRKPIDVAALDEFLDQVRAPSAAAPG
jgi:two-component system, cell cycle sensor histidine kinase and response regulator CckA